MIGAVLFRKGTPEGKAILSLLEDMDPIEVRGLGKVFRYSLHRKSLYFVPVDRDLSFNGRILERQVFHALGRPSFLISFYPPEGDRVFLHATGNVTSSNPLLHPSFSPRSVSPTDPDLLGTLYVALRKIGVPVSVVAVHDPPSDLSTPHIVIRTPESYVEDVLPALIASVRRRKIFVPYVTVSASYTADYFDGVFLRRRISAYHVPYYWAHFLDASLFSQMVEKGKVRKILVQRGLELPGELPHEEV